MRGHGQHATRARVMLAGRVTSALYAFFHHRSPALGAKAVAAVCFRLHATSSAVMLVSLLFLYGGQPSFHRGAEGGSMAFGLDVLLFAFVALPAMWKE